MSKIEYHTIGYAEYIHTGKWFKPDAIKFFRSRFSNYCIEKDNKLYFISSEQYMTSSGEKFQRKYSIRMIDKNKPAKVETIGNSEQRYLSSTEAKRELKKILSLKELLI
jgi:hypothetical protein